VFTAERTLTNANFWLLNGQRRTQQRYSDQQKTRCKKVAVSAVGSALRDAGRARPRAFPLGGKAKMVKADPTLGTGL